MLTPQGQLQGNRGNSVIFHAVDSHIWTQWVKLLRIFLGILAQTKQAQMSAMLYLAKVAARV